MCFVYDTGLMESGEEDEEDEERAIDVCKSCSRKQVWGVCGVVVVVVSRRQDKWYSLYRDVKRAATGRRRGKRAQ